MSEVAGPIGHGGKKYKSIIDTRSKTFRALYWWGKFVGVNPLTLTENVDLEVSYFGFFYGCLLGAISCYIFYLALVERWTMLMPGETPIAIIVDFMGIGWQFLETSVTLFAFAVRQDAAKIVVENFARAERTSRKLGIPHDYDGDLRIFAVHVTVNNILNLGSMVLSENLRSYVHTYDMLVWWMFNVITLIGFNMVMLFVWSLVLVNRKFRRLNEKVRSLIPDGSPEGIDVVTRLHRELRNVVRFVEEFFAPLVFFSVGKNFTFITIQCYMTYEYTKGHSKLDTLDFFFLSATSYWALSALIGLIVLSKVCGATLCEANSTGHILHGMLNDNVNLGDAKEFAKLNLLSLDLLGNHVSISVLGLFRLDSFLVYSTVSSAMTYLTIMLQFYN